MKNFYINLGAQIMVWFVLMGIGMGALAFVGLLYGAPIPWFVWMFIGLGTLSIIELMFCPFLKLWLYVSERK